MWPATFLFLLSDPAFVRLYPIEHLQFFFLICQCLLKFVHIKLRIFISSCLTYLLFDKKVLLSRNNSLGMEEGAVVLEIIRSERLTMTSRQCLLSVTRSYTRFGYPYYVLVLDSPISGSVCVMLTTAAHTAGSTGEEAGATHVCLSCTMTTRG